jgi:lauroyl/myristoyl acyltransferase
VNVENLASLLALKAAGVPMVMATLHTQSATLLRYILRSHGIPAATLVLNADAHDEKTNQRDALLDEQMGMVGLPNLFDIREMRAAMRFLQKGGCLIIACDIWPAQRLMIHTPQGGFTMALGPLRMARSTGATVFPAIVFHEPRWRVTVHIGNPLSIPHAGRGDCVSVFQSACEEFTHFVLPIIAKYPAQMDPAHVHSWSP